MTPWINPRKTNSVAKRKSRLSLDVYYEGLMNHDRLILSRSITLIESELEEDRELSRKLLTKILPFTGNSYRVGITGVPGVGKSTFIDAFGEYLIKEGKKLAVLAVDPSSSASKGSILGDKTRMNLLSQNPHAFVRPSPTSGSLGGVTRKTRETLLLCEAAGFEVILIETVGVGQSELAVKGMVDFFLLLMLPNAGDELQGIKRGIMEMADAIFVNKSDGPFKASAQKAKVRYKQAIQLQKAQEDWKVPVLMGSGLQKEGIEDVWKLMLKFQQIKNDNVSWDRNRKDQFQQWLEESIEAHLLRMFYKDPVVKDKLIEAKEAIRQLALSPESIAQELVTSWAAHRSIKKGSK